MLARRDRLRAFGRAGKASDRPGGTGGRAGSGEYQGNRDAGGGRTCGRAGTGECTRAGRRAGRGEHTRAGRERRAQQHGRAGRLRPAGRKRRAHMARPSVRRALPTCPTEQSHLPAAGALASPGIPYVYRRPSARAPVRSPLPPPPSVFSGPARACARLSRHAHLCFFRPADVCAGPSRPARVCAHHSRPA